MSDNFTKIKFDTVFNVKSIVTLFYMELNKNFKYDGESHNFWEMVYIDKGEMICTAGKNRFTLKSGEIAFHKPNEFHNLEGNNVDSPNVSIITFDCNNTAMSYFDGKIFKLNHQEKFFLSQLFAEGLSCYEMEDENNPLIKKKHSKNNFVKLIDITNIVMDDLPIANINTRFTPYCMLRLYADLIDEIPDKIMYLDNDVVCLKNPIDFYNIDNSNYELVGVLDYYGSHFYKKNIFKKDYLNSGVLLLNVRLIKESKLLEKCRERCRKKKMLLPDQAALNKYAKNKLIVNRKYNEQKQDTDDTVFRHFSTTFKFFPKFATQTIKPWHIEELHNVLNVYRIDDVLEEYQRIKKGINK